MELNQFIGLFMIAPAKSAPESEDPKDIFQSFKKAIFNDFKVNGVGNGFTKATNYKDGIPRHINISPEQKKELMEAKYPEPLNVTADLFGN